MSQSPERPATLHDLQLVLLDRDGVINFDSAEFIKSPAEWHPLPGAIAAIVKLQAFVAVAVCTNQSGVGRGLFDESTLGAIHDKLNAHIEASGGRPVDVFYCPHHPQDHCPCRKPEPELLRLAMRAYNAQPDLTLYLGDSEKDLLAAERADCVGALVLTGNGAKTALTQAGKRARVVCDELASLAALLQP